MDVRFKLRLEELSKELNTSYHELIQSIKDYIEGNKIRLSGDVKQLISEVKRSFYINYRLNLNYN